MRLGEYAILRNNNDDIECAKCSKPIYKGQKMAFDIRNRSLGGMMSGGYLCLDCVPEGAETQQINDD